MLAGLKNPAIVLLLEVSALMHKAHRTTKSRPTNARILRIGLVAALATIALHCSSPGAVSTRLKYAGVYLPDTTALRASARCEDPAHHWVFYVLYGSAVIDRQAPEVLFPHTERRFYLIEENKTISDWVVSLLFGTLFTVTRSSMYITPCEIPEGEAALAPFRARPQEPGGSAASIDEPGTIQESGDSGSAGPARNPEAAAEVQKRIDAARERARAARERAEGLRRRKDSR